MSTETQLPRLKFHLVNAFALTPHSGNQAAVVLFPKDDPRVLDEAYLQSLAADFNYADSAFVVPVNADAHPPEYNIRWFTPTTEVPLCGHATLATSFILLNYVHPGEPSVLFHTRMRGDVLARLEEGGQGGRVAVNLHIAPTATGSPESSELGGIIAEACGFSASDIEQVATYDLGGPSAFTHVAEHVALGDLQVTPSRLLPRLAADVVVTQLLPPTADTPPDTVRAACRVFGPGLGTDEDPVTGSSWAMLTGYYLNGPGSEFTKRFLPAGSDLSRVTLDARQLSARGGSMTCTLSRDGQAQLVGQAWRTGHGFLETF